MLPFKTLLENVLRDEHMKYNAFQMKAFKAENRAR